MLKAKISNRRHSSHTTHDAIENVQLQERKSLHFTLPETLYIAFKKKAIDEKTTMRDVLENLIISYVNPNNG